MSRLFLRIAWTCIIIFIIFMITLFTGIIDISVFVNRPVLVAIVFMFPFLFGTIFAIIGLAFGQNRSIYLARIKEYRQLKAFRDIMDCIHFKDFEAYNNRLVDGNPKDFLYGYFLGSSLTADEPIASRSLVKLKRIYDAANPSKINFNFNS